MSLVYKLGRRVQCQPVKEWSSSLEGLYPKVKEENLYSKHFQRRAKLQCGITQPRWQLLVFISS